MPTERGEGDNAADETFTGNLEGWIRTGPNYSGRPVPAGHQVAGGAEPAAAGGGTRPKGSAGGRRIAIILISVALLLLIVALLVAVFLR